MKLATEPGAGHRFRFWAVACLLLSAAGPPAHANENRAAQALLQRMVHAVRSTNYSGVCIYRFGDNLQAIRIIHQAKKGYQHERLISLSGPAREIIRDNAQATYIEPTDNSIAEKFRLLNPPLNASFPGNSARPGKADDLSDVYDLKLVGSGRVAGRDAKRLDIVPHDHFRYGYRLWIDEDSGLLLRSDLIDEAGKPLEQIMFTVIKTPKTIPDQRLEPTLAGDEVTWYREHAPPATVISLGSAWEVGGLPEGFELISQEHHPRAGGRDGSVEHRLYSDGLATVSVYIQQESDHPFNGWSRMGAVSAFGRTLDGYQIIVVGEVPPLTIQLIGKSVRGAVDEPWLKRSRR